MPLVRQCYPMQAVLPSAAQPAPLWVRATPAESNFVTTLGNFSLDVRSANNVIAGNFLGLAVDGVTPLTTAGFQIYLMNDGNIVQGNRIANATSAGIWVDGVQHTTIRRNSNYANAWIGIFLFDDANNNLPAPSFSLDAFGGSGTTCPGCTVELFLDEGNQGRFYFDSVVADNSGNFSFPLRCPVPYPYMNATVTDLQGNTSEFNAPHYSEPHLVPWDCSTARPIPSLVSSRSHQPATALFHLSVNPDRIDFYTDLVVHWNGLALPTIFISSTQIPGGDTLLSTSRWWGCSAHRFHPRTRWW